MIDREDLTFATCNQLASIISLDWEENQPEEITGVLKGLAMIDEPGEGPGGLLLGLSNLLQLSTLDTEPSCVRKSKTLAELKLAIAVLKSVMELSDSWNTKDSDTIKKEVISRISRYEDEKRTITDPLPFKCNITV